MIKDKKLLIHSILAFLFGFGFIYVCYVGLPFDFNADHPMNIQGAESLSYGQLAKLAGNPLTPTWFYPPDSRTDLMAYVRPIQFLILKFFYVHFGYVLPPFHIAVAAGFGFLAAAIFISVFPFAKSILFAWLAVGLYFSFPSNVFLMLSDFALDFQPFVSALFLVVLFIFGKFTSGKTKPLPWFLLQLAGFFLLVWFTIKLKATEKVIPLILLGFLTLRFKPVLKKLGTSRLAALITSIVLMFILVIPLAPFSHWAPVKESLADRSTDLAPTSQKDKQVFGLSIDNMLQRTFWVKDGSFSLFRPGYNIKPLSLTENLGFLLGWLFWIMLLLTPILLASTTKKPGDHPNDKSESSEHSFYLISAWLGLVLLGFASGPPLTECRFLNFALLPAVLLLFLMLTLWEKRFFISPFSRGAFRTGITVLILVSVLPNLVTFSKLLGHFGGMQDALVRIEKDIMPHILGTTPNDRSLFEQHYEMEQRAVIVDWYNLPDDWIDLTRKKLEREGTVFFYTRRPGSKRLAQLKEAGFSPELWKQYSLLDSKPLIFRLFSALYRIKALSARAPSVDIYVYQIKKPAPR